MHPLSLLTPQVSTSASGTLTHCTTTAAARAAGWVDAPDPADGMLSGLADAATLARVANDRGATWTCPSASASARGPAGVALGPVGLVGRRPPPACSPSDPAPSDSGRRRQPPGTPAFEVTPSSRLGPQEFRPREVSQPVAVVAAPLERQRGSAAVAGAGSRRDDPSRRRRVGREPVEERRAVHLEGARSAGVPRDGVVHVPGAGSWPSPTPPSLTVGLVALDRGTSGHVAPAPANSKLDRCRR